MVLGGQSGVVELPEFVSPGELMAVSGLLCREASFELMAVSDLLCREASCGRPPSYRTTDDIAAEPDQSTKGS